jgi:hypothetical protein
VLGREHVGVLGTVVWGVELSNKKYMKMKYTMALDGRRSMIFNTTTKQKMHPKYRGLWRGGATSRRRGEVQYHRFWRGQSSQEGRKLK